MNRPAPYKGRGGSAVNGPAERGEAALGFRRNPLGTRRLVQMGDGPFTGDNEIFTGAKAQHTASRVPLLLKMQEPGRNPLFPSRQIKTAPVLWHGGGSLQL